MSNARIKRYAEIQSPWRAPFGILKYDVVIPTWTINYS